MKNILKRIYSPVFLPLSWIIYLLSLSFGILRLHYYLSPSSKFLHFIGLVASVFWHLRVIFLILFFIILVLEFVRSINKGNKTHDGLFLVITAILCFISFLVASKLLSIRTANYPNYLYVKYGLISEDVMNISDISALTLVSIVSFLAFVKRGVLYSLRKFKKETVNIEIIFSILGLLILIWFAISPIIHFKNYINYAKNDYEYIFEDYKYIYQLSILTPKDSKIIVPVQSMTWPAIGNPLIVRYFLYPRTIVSSSYITDKNLSTIKKAYFIEIERGDTEKHWPKINFKEKTIIFDKNNISYKSLTLFLAEKGMNIYLVEF